MCIDKLNQENPNYRLYNEKCMFQKLLRESLDSLPLGCRRYEASVNIWVDKFSTFLSKLSPCYLKSWGRWRQSYKLPAGHSGKRVNKSVTSCVEWRGGMVWLFSGHSSRRAFVLVSPFCNSLLINMISCYSRFRD